jgi:hypothetical protein
MSMADESKPKLEDLELNRESLQDLADEAARSVKGGRTSSCAKGAPAARLNPLLPGTGPVRPE